MGFETAIASGLCRIKIKRLTFPRSGMAQPRLEIPYPRARASLTENTPSHRRGFSAYVSFMVSDPTSANRVPARKLAGLIGTLWAGLEAGIPFGYQNETGFHYGIEFISSLLESSPENGADPLLPWSGSSA